MQTDENWNGDSRSSVSLNEERKASMIIVIALGGAHAMGRALADLRRGVPDQFGNLRAEPRTPR